MGDLLDFPSPPRYRTGWPWTGGKVSGSGAEGGPRVTIVTPSYNQGVYLEETIRSVLLQGYENLEYIVVDGGSTDDSIKIIERYSPWITWWVSEADRGQADAINKGFARSTGEIIGWLNSDDILYQGFIERRVREFEQTPGVGLIFGDVELGKSSDAVSGQMRGRSTDFLTMVRTLEVPIPQQSALWRAGVVERVGGLDDRWEVVLDREFFMRVARNFEMAYRPGAVGFFRLHPNSKSVAQELKWVDELPTMYREFFSDPGLPASVAGLERESMVAVERLCAQLLWRNRCFRDWFGCVGRAASQSPHEFARQFVIDEARRKIRGAVRRVANLAGSDRKP